MRSHYDFSKMKGKKNPYTKYLKQRVTMRLDADVLEYFKTMAEETGVPYQTLINNYLRDCAMKERKLKMEWKSR
ncbi:MAG: BrnA antitoxin family protein [Candidatus Omnitrophica bacterium]|nr:BrnA antitoxin family protein [Candidatus Omnitrophota bacterium]MCB9782487.1 BrnA antitoxin family protein [Candidatus Omnitrophota bacterium]